MAQLPSLIDQMNTAMETSRRTGEPMMFFIDGWEVSEEDMRHYIETGNAPIWLTDKQQEIVDGKDGR